MLRRSSIRFAPPLVISEEDVRRAVRIIAESLAEFDTVSPARRVLLVLADVPQIEKIPGDDAEEHDTVIELED